MVVTAAAAIGAAGYGLYKGGEAGVKKGKECQRELQREKKRSTQRSSLREKTNKRSSRIAEIVQMKEKGSASSMSMPGITSATAISDRLSRLGFGGASASATPAPSTTPASPNTVGSFSERQLAEKEASSDINDRHRAVMEKLKSSRTKERQKGSSSNSSKLRSLNPFKKK